MISTNVIKIASDTFQTKLGTIETWVETTDGSALATSGQLYAETASYLISLEPIELETKNLPLPEGYTVESWRGWRWRLRKTSDQPEELTIYCKLINPTDETSWEIAGGEHLDAIEIENATDELHIGTEDGEMLQSRAAKGDEMPKRFKKQLGYWSDDYSFTDSIPFGFKTTVPSLLNDEVVYFQFLVATNPIRPSANYPDGRDVATWFAVDVNKSFLDLCV